MLAACVPPPAPTQPPPAAAKRAFVAVPVENDAFPASAQLLTDLLRRARLRDMDPPAMGKVSLEVIQLSIECVDPTLECYAQVGRSLHADLMLMGEITPGAGKDDFTATVSLLDVPGKKWIKRSARKFATEDDAKYDLHLVVEDVTK